MTVIDMPAVIAALDRSLGRASSQRTAALIVRGTTLAEKVRLRRLELRQSQAQLGAAIGVKQQSIQSIETGKTTRPRRIVELAGALGVTPEWLLLGKAEGCVK